MNVLKLGGSLLTHKEERFSLREGILEKLGNEIQMAKDPTVVIHGGGSYGHPLAQEYKLQFGYKDPSQIKGVVLTRNAMTEFNRVVVEALSNVGLNAVSLQTSSLAICNQKKILTFNTDLITGFLKLGLLPVLYGDVVLDHKQGFCILSGDRIVTYLSKHLKPNRIILAIDKAGIFDRDPVEDGATLIKEVNQDNYREVLTILSKASKDVTGGLKGKLSELLILASEGMESVIINGLVPGRLSKALLGNQVKGTRIKGGSYDDWI
jgi:isopentenyl phosphate kinase